MVKKIFEEIEFQAEPAGLYDPLRYMISIGGKRIRPKLCLLTYSLFKNEFGIEITEPAAALEVFHSFTLIHDDIMDNSPLRRGVPTVWKKWDPNTAILSGDVMLIDAYKRVAKAPVAVLDRVFDLFTTTAAQVCDGQQYDMEFESKGTVPMRDYEKMIGLKTAVLIACAAKMGAIIGGASDSECDALYQYGYELGMAFQVADDYLDAFGDEKVFGKPIGGDIINRKKSWLTIRLMDKMTPEARADFEKMFGSEPSDREARIGEVRSLYEKYSVDEEARREVRRYSDRAMDAIKGLAISDCGRKLLADFAEGLVGRAV